MALQLRVGLNSGRVIAGGIGSGSQWYTATGEPIGFAHRMESAAPPGAVMLSEATARLVEHMVVLAEPEWVHLKGADQPVPARRLIAISPRNGLVGRAEARLVGRRWEMAALDAIVDRVIGGHGGVVNVVGPPGIGKSRVARAAAALAAGRGVEVFWAFCESHARDVPFFAVTRLLRAGSGVADSTGKPPGFNCGLVSADADLEDLLLLDDLLGVADPDVPPPQIDPDARRRRLTALINTVSTGADRTGAVHHRGRTLDRCGQRVDADRLPVRHFTHPVDGADHRPARVRGGAQPRVRSPDDSACPACRFGYGGAAGRAAGFAFLGRRPGGHHRRPGRR